MGGNMQPRNETNKDLVLEGNSLSQEPSIDTSSEKDGITVIESEIWVSPTKVGRSGDKLKSQVSVNISSSKFSILADEDELVREESKDRNEADIGFDTEEEISEAEEGELPNQDQITHNEKKKEKMEIRKSIPRASKPTPKASIRKLAEIQHGKKSWGRGKNSH